MFRGKFEIFCALLFGATFEDPEQQVELFEENRSKEWLRGSSSF
jgi:hypothetical protein